MIHRSDRSPGTPAPAFLPEFMAAHLEREAPATDATLSDVLHSIRKYLGMEVAFISEFVAGQRVFRYVDADSGAAPIVVGGVGPLDESYCQRVVEGRLPGLIHNAVELPAALELPVTGALPVGAHLSVPIRFSDGSLYGTLCCFSASPDRSLNGRDLAMMRVFADFTGRLLEREVLERRELQGARSRVQSVLDSRSFTMVYQPIVNVLEHRIIGYEALTRFSAAPARSPDLWFKEAELVGLQARLEVAVIEAALARLDELPAGTYLSLNVSAETVQSGLLAPILEASVPGRIVLELTEHEAIADYDAFLAALAPLRREGLALAVDDAGAGYACFRHILRLRPELIKLDISLTRDIDTDPARRALAVALIQFAAETGSKIVAEGVETQGELDTLRSLRVNKAQGFWLGRPMPFERLMTRL